MNTNAPKTLALEVVKQAQAVGHRMHEQEAIILSSRSGALIGRYAQTVIKSRWPEAEKLLLKHAGPSVLVQYAEKVIKGRWPEAEQRIINETTKIRWVLRYVEKCVKDRWPEAEQRLLTDATLDPLVDYAAKYVGPNWPEAEERVLADATLDHPFEYAEKHVGAEWPDLAWKLEENGKVTNMKSVMSLRKTKAKGNAYGYARIDILVLNYDGKGGAIVRFDKKPDLESMSAGDLEIVLFGDPGEGTRYYRPARS